ncbi:peptidoglycan-binding protein [Streptomyces sp. NPDC058953]|uniref:peptidoglycan-binding protein n=1 Tax=unclassified Streptomyces TaxID=2593676 RepID=UPI00367D6C53
MHPRWKALPEGTDPRITRFVAELRGLKDHHELDMAALARRTGYSKSSWDRYLNGRSPAPAAAVEALARLCDVDREPLLVLRELAAEAYESETPDDPGDPGDQGDPEPGAAPPKDPVPEGPRRASGPNPWIVAAVSSALTALLILGAFVLIDRWDEEPAEAVPKTAATVDSHPKLGEFAFEAGKVYPCEVRRDRDGLLSAGYSGTRTELIERYSTRWSVVEAQCLLAHHGLEPGGADGAFGNGTERAVKRLQDQSRIAVDGVIGPDTWKALRG